MPLHDHMRRTLVRTVRVETVALAVGVDVARVGVDVLDDLGDVGAVARGVVAHGSIPFIVTSLMADRTRHHDLNHGDHANRQKPIQQKGSP